MNNHASDEPYDLCTAFDRVVAERPLTDALQWLAEQFASRDDAHRLFEVRKMQSRARSGKPLLNVRHRNYRDMPRDEALERDLMAACREAGQLLVQRHRFQQAWQFLSPLDDVAWVRQLFATHPPRADEVNEWIDVTLYQGAHPVAGYQQVLRTYGTCQAISTWDAVQAHLYPDDRSAMAEALVAHCYGEICDNICRQLRELSDKHPGLEGLVEEWTSLQGQTDDTGPRVLRDFWLAHVLEHAADEVASSVPHCDATHLVAVVRIGRMSLARPSWQRLVELCDYGSLLPPTLQYPDQQPFDQTYTDHKHYYRALLGQDVESAVAHMISKLPAQIESPEQWWALEVIVDWLDRLGKAHEAIELAISKDASLLGQSGVSPTLLELGVKAGFPPTLADYFRRRQDLLSYAMTRIAERS